MKNLLAIDIGNTTITIGIFRNEYLLKKTKIATHRLPSYRRSLKRFLNKYELEGVIISSVVPNALASFKRILYKITDAKITTLGEDINTPIKNLYRIKKQVGQDRLVNAFAAKTLYGTPCVIVDFGTAITFDIVSGKGEYLGGLILPGIELSLSSLYEKTALLPKVKLKPTRYIIGKDTIGSMRGGILFGFGAMCDSLVSKYRKTLGKGLKVIATGGNAYLIRRYANSIQIVDEDLTLKGLRIISRRIFKNFS